MLLLSSIAMAGPAFAQAPAPQDFLEQHCYDCHDAGSKKAASVIRTAVTA